MESFEEICRNEFNTHVDNIIDDACKKALEEVEAEEKRNEKRLKKGIIFTSLFAALLFGYAAYKKQS